MNGVQHVEEIVSGWAFAGRILVRKEDHHVGVLLKLWIEGFNRQFVIMWDLDGCNLGFLEQLLLADEDVLQKVLVDHALVREVELEAEENEKLETILWNVEHSTYCWSK